MIFDFTCTFQFDTWKMVIRKFLHEIPLLFANRCYCLIQQWMEIWKSTQYIEVFLSRIRSFEYSIKILFHDLVVLPVRYNPIALRGKRKKTTDNMKLFLIFQIKISLFFKNSEKNIFINEIYELSYVMIFTKRRTLWFLRNVMCVPFETSKTKRLTPVLHRTFIYFTLVAQGSKYLTSINLR